MPKRRDQILLAALLAVLAFVGYRAWRGPAAPVRSASNRTAPARRGRAAAVPLEAPDVHLQALNAERPAPATSGRDLFQFGARQAAPVAAPPTAAAPRGVLPPQAPPATAGNTVPPIGLKFIGLVEATGSDARIAILSDGRGAPLYGREGDAIAGRYRILHIGAESVEMAYLDGRGRQTIRLSGS